AGRRPRACPSGEGVDGLEWVLVEQVGREHPSRTCSSPASRPAVSRHEGAWPPLRENGSAAATAHHVHRTVRTALGEAERRGYLMRNPAALARPSRLEEA